jgi:hypothetical protein
MAHFAQIDENNVVIQVIVIEQDVIDTGAFGDPTTWIQTSYNNSFRNTYAGIGYEWHEELNAFISPKPFNSWILDTNTCSYIAPKPYPIDDKTYMWIEQTFEWIEITLPVLPSGE